MRRLLCVTAVLATLVGCNTNGLPGPGDIVSPNLVRPVNWTAGKSGEVWAELSAKSKSGVERRLSFAASPVNNPIASVVFYNAEGDTIGGDEVELSQRC